MRTNIEEIIRRLREESPLLGRNARIYIADALQGLFNSQVAHFGESDSEANAVDKIVSNASPGFDAPNRGTKLAVHFTYGNTASNIRLRVRGADNSASEPVHSVVKGSNWAAGSTVEFVFDGTNWRMLSSKVLARIAPVEARTGQPAFIGTDNGEYSPADHRHPVTTNHDTSHVTTGRFDLDRLPTSSVDNRVLAVGTAGTSPAFQQVNDQMIADNAVRTRHILDLNVTEPKLADNAVITRTILDRNVTEPKLADNAVVTRTILDQNVTEPKLADDSVSTRTIIDQNVTEPKLANDSVSTRTIIDGNVTTSKINDLAVTEPKMANNSVSTRTIIDRNVTEPKLADNSVSTRTIINQNVTEPKLANDSVSTRTIIDQNVTEPKLANDSVSTRTIIDQNVTEAKLANDSVSTRTIIDQNVTEPKLADDAVSTRTIINQNVTEPKLANDSVSTRTIIDQNVTTPKIADRNVTTDKINDLAVTEPKIADNAVVTRTIMDQNITTEKIADRNVTTEKVAHRAVTGHELMTSNEDNMVLRVGAAGTDPYFAKVNMATDFDGVLPIERGGTGANNPIDARENLGTASEVEFRDHVENHDIHVTERDRELWQGETFGPFNAHDGVIDITFAEGKRFRLTGSGTCTAHDGTGNRISSLVRYHPWGQGSSSSNPINFGDNGSVTIHGTIGWTAARVGYADIILHFHGDDTWYNVQVFSRANNSNTGGEAPSGTRLQQVRILVKEMI